MQVKPIEFFDDFITWLWKKYFSDAECILAIWFYRLRSIIDNPTTKINAAEAGVSVGNFRRTTGGKIKNGLAERLVPLKGWKKETISKKGGIVAEEINWVSFVIPAG